MQNACKEVFTERSTVVRLRDTKIWPSVSCQSVFNRTNNVIKQISLSVSSNIDRIARQRGVDT